MMSVFWDKIFAPLLIVLATLIVVWLILYVYGYVVNLVSLIIGQHKIRKTLKVQVKRSCKQLEEIVMQTLSPLLEGVNCLDQTNEVKTKSDENGEYVIFYDDDGKPEKKYVADLLEETFGKEFADMYKESHKEEK